MVLYGQGNDDKPIGWNGVPNFGTNAKSFTHGDVVFTHMKGFVIFPQSETIILK